MLNFLCKSMYSDRLNKKNQGTCYFQYESGIGGYLIEMPNPVVIMFY
jgi:hypothetical protein